MVCRKIQRQLVPYVDGKLSAHWQSKVTLHLEGCPNCAADATALRKLHAVFDAGAEATVPQRLETEVLRGVRTMAPEVGAGEWFRWLMPLAAGACAVGVAVFLAGRTNGPQPPGQETPRVAQAPGPEVIVEQPEGGEVPPSAEQTKLAQRDRSQRGESASGPTGGDEVPPELRDALDLFVDYPIILDLEKFEHYDTIWANTEEVRAGATRGG